MTGTVTTVDRARPGETTRPAETIRTVDATALLDAAGYDGPVESVRAARALGSRLAATVDRRYGDATPRALVDAFDLRLVRDDWAGIGDVHLLGTYGDGEITIYPRAIADRADALDADPAALEGCVLAHELGHHLLVDVTFGAEPTGLLRRIVPFLGGRATGQRTLEEHAAAQFSTDFTGHRPPESVGVATSPAREQSDALHHQ